MPGPGRTRLACDRCHAQKLRCPKQAGSACCTRCLKAGVRCVFSPVGGSSGSSPAMATSGAGTETGTGTGTGTAAGSSAGMPAPNFPELAMQGVDMAAFAWPFLQPDVGGGLTFDQFMNTSLDGMAPAIPAMHREGMGGDFNGGLGGGYANPHGDDAGAAGGPPASKRRWPGEDGGGEPVEAAAAAAAPTTSTTAPPRPPPENPRKRCLSQLASLLRDLETLYDSTPPREFHHPHDESLTGFVAEFARTHPRDDYLEAVFACFHGLAELYPAATELSLCLDAAEEGGGGGEENGKEEGDDEASRCGIPDCVHRLPLPPELAGMEAAVSSRSRERFTSSPSSSSFSSDATGGGGPTSSSSGSGSGSGSGMNGHARSSAAAANSAGDDEWAKLDSALAGLLLACHLRLLDVMDRVLAVVLSCLRVSLASGHGTGDGGGGGLPGAGAGAGGNYNRANDVDNFSLPELRVGSFRASKASALTMQAVLLRHLASTMGERLGWFSGVLNRRKGRQQQQQRQEEEAEEDDQDEAEECDGPGNLEQQRRQRRQKQRHQWRQNRRRLARETQLLVLQCELLRERHDEKMEQVATLGEMLVRFGLVK